MKILFLDESGDRNRSVIDLQHPLFVLGGIVVEKACAAGPMTGSIINFNQAAS